jgi:NTP pyrophosphatase (non-canonical NTP hydrolase)
LQQFLGEREAGNPCQEAQSKVDLIVRKIRSKIEERTELEERLRDVLRWIGLLEEHIQSGDLTPEERADLQRLVDRLVRLAQSLGELIQNLGEDLQELAEQLADARLALVVCLANNSGRTPGVQDDFHPSRPQISQQEFDFDGASSAASSEVFDKIDQVLEQAQAILGSQ